MNAHALLGPRQQTLQQCAALCDEFANVTVGHSIALLVFKHLHVRYAGYALLCANLTMQHQDLQIWEHT